MKTPVHPSARRSRGAFALVTTLLILSLLAIVAVSYLSSMAAERQTAEAYSSKAVAEQAAQTAVDNATAMLAQSFRDFPDSATVWDTTQTVNANGGTTYNASTVVGGANNEGTSLYLRAVPSASGASAYAVALPPGVTYASNGTSYAANDPNGNDPNNPACQTFVLPLISGVPNGQARLVSAKGSVFSAGMNLGESDPAKQNWTDLNVRRSYGDVQGVIGSPPVWNSTVGPKPARAYWVDLKGSNGLTTGRYAFWIEDESFRTNVNLVGNTTPRADNASNSRPLLPGDAVLSGALFSYGSNNTTYADRMIATRDSYPGKFLPDPSAFAHSATSGTGASGFDAATADGLRYLTTTQSGSLNLTRHGTERLNLNATTTIARDSTGATLPVTMSEIRKLVETIRFHLPNFGQRFYRTTNPDLTANAGNRATILNRLTDVSTSASAPHAEMYLYKTAANLRDYIDTDDQPTMIVRPLNGAALPALAAATAPTHPFGSDGQGNDGINYMWAQGKDGAPFIQEAMVRYRPAVQNSGENYTLTVDYYVEVWNMSDHDIAATSLNHPFLRISNQQTWYSAYIDKSPTQTKPVSTTAVPTPSAPLTVTDNGISPGGSPLTRDFNLDLLQGVYGTTGSAGPAIAVPNGVVFKAGTATVITTDPDFVGSSAVINSRFIYGGQVLGANGFYGPNIYYCSRTLPENSPAARRTFAGPTALPYVAGKLRGIMPEFRGPRTSTVYLDFEVETTLGNDLGYLDCALGAFCISAGSGDGGSTSTNGFDFTWTDGVSPNQVEPHNDYLHGGTLAGNGTTPSQSGDPRTNNEQLVLTTFNGTSFPAQPDQARYGSPAKLLAPPFSLGTPNTQYLKPANATTSGYSAWGDYYDWPGTGAYPLDPTANPANTMNAANAPSVIANSALTSIGQLGDIFDPLRVIGTVGSYNINNSRGGGRTLKVGQRDDRFTYDTTGNLPNSQGTATNTINNVPASNGWAAWRLADVFSIGDALELPGRVNVNGVPRDNGAALRAALTGFDFQPQTNLASPQTTTDRLTHGDANLAGLSLATDPTAATGVQKLVEQITNRLALTPAVAVNTSTSGYNTPWGPFFERGELGELENAQPGATASNSTIPFFGKSAISAFSTPITTTSTALTGKDFNRVSDRGREELFRRLAELICTRGDTFTVYAVGQSMAQTTATATPKVTGTQRMRVTFRLVPKYYNTYNPTNPWEDFRPGYLVNSTTGVVTPADFNPDSASNLRPTQGDSAQGLKERFAKPDRYEVQFLSVSTY